MKVALFDLKRQHKQLENELAEVFSRQLLPCNYILGEAVLSFEQKMAAYLKATYALGVSSGTDAILMALMALDIGPGDEVLCPAFTFFATAGVIARLGARPIWVDSSDVDFNMCALDAAKKITSWTKAIIYVHLFGQAGNFQPIFDLANERSIPLIEDVAQSMGGIFKGKQLGTMGLMGCFSFYPTKNLGALGDAGLVTTNDPELADKLKKIRVHGSERRYYHPILGGNFRIDALQAGFLEAKLPFVENFIKRRQANAAYYQEELVTISPFLILPSTAEDNEHTYNQFTVQVKGGLRDQLKEFLASAGIGSEVYYPLTMDQQLCFTKQTEGQDLSSLKTAHQLSHEVLSLPIFPELEREELAYVVRTVKQFFAKNPIANETKNSQETCITQ